MQYRALRSSGLQKCRTIANTRSGVHRLVSTPKHAEHLYDARPFIRSSVAHTRSLVIRQLPAERTHECQGVEFARPELVMSPNVSWQTGTLRRGCNCRCIATRALSVWARCAKRHGSAHVRLLQISPVGMRGLAALRAPLADELSHACPPGKVWLNSSKRTGQLCFVTLQWC